MKALLCWILGWLLALGIGPFPDLARYCLNPGESTETTVRSLLGTPDSTHDGPGGGQVWEYPRGPAGLETWMVEIGPDGRYQGMRNVLVDATFSRLAPGDPVAEVRRRLGRPLAVAEFPARGERVLSWKYRADDGRSEHFNAHFDAAGRLVRVSRTPDPEAINAQ